MKKAFTMVELVFVIIIIGVLATIGLPRITTGKKDAEYTKFISDVSTVLIDAQNYIESYGEFPDDLRSITNVNIDEDNQLGIKSAKCIKFAKNAKFSNILEVSKLATTDKACVKMMENDKIISLLSSHYTCPKLDEKEVSEMDKIYDCNGTVGLKDGDGAEIEQNIKNNTKVIFKYTTDINNEEIYF